MNDEYELVDCTKWLNYELCEIERKEFLAMKYNKVAFERTAERNFVHSVVNMPELFEENERNESK